MTKTSSLQVFEHYNGQSSDSDMKWIISNEPRIVEEVERLESIIYPAFVEGLKRKQWNETAGFKIWTNTVHITSPRAKLKPLGNRFVYEEIIARARLPEIRNKVIVPARADITKEVVMGNYGERHYHRDQWKKWQLSLEPYTINMAWNGKEKNAQFRFWIGGN